MAEPMRDPLEDDPGPGVCLDCTHGWLYLSERTVERENPWPVEPEPTGDEEADAVTSYAYAMLVRDVESRRGAARNTVYPCKRCRPKLFRRWLHGHLKADHDTGDCQECRELPGRSHRRAM